MIAIEYTPHPVSILKRIFDIFSACTGLLLSAPLMPFLALAIILETPGPILYRQQRIGRCFSDHTKLFWMYKFRTMGVDSEKTSGAVWAKKGDPRITRIGRFLRKTRLDEIPQFWNVLIGDKRRVVHLVFVNK